MRLLQRQEIEALITTGQLVVECDGGPMWLDDLRLGLRVSDKVSMRIGPLAIDEPCEFHDHSLAELAANKTSLYPKTLYLIPTAEKIRLPRHVMGRIQTRSCYARQGLEVVTSSDFVIPGFGSTEPTALVLEPRPAVPITGLREGGCYCFLLLYDIGFCADDRTEHYAGRFPLGRD